jgi:hypothetical protein
MLGDTDNKILKLKQDDIHVRVRGVLTVMIRNDCAYQQMCINHQRRATSVKNTGALINLPLLKTTVATWAALTNGTEWLIAIQLVTEPMFMFLTI